MRYLLIFVVLLSSSCAKYEYVCECYNFATHEKVDRFEYETDTKGYGHAEECTKHGEDHNRSVGWTPGKNINDTLKIYCQPVYE